MPRPAPPFCANRKGGKNREGCRPSTLRNQVRARPRWRRSSLVALKNHLAQNGVKTLQCTLIEPAENEKLCGNHLIAAILPPLRRGRSTPLRILVHAPPPKTVDAPYEQSYRSKNPQRNKLANRYFKATRRGGHENLGQGWEERGGYRTNYCDSDN